MTDRRTDGRRLITCGVVFSRATCKTTVELRSAVSQWYPEANYLPEPLLSPSARNSPFLPYLSSGLKAFRPVVCFRNRGSVVAVFVFFVLVVDVRNVNTLRYLRRLVSNQAP